jgi:hypothetical protein
LAGPSAYFSVGPGLSVSYAEKCSQKKEKCLTSEDCRVSRPNPVEALFQ